MNGASVFRDSLPVNRLKKSELRALIAQLLADLGGGTVNIGSFQPIVWRGRTLAATSDRTKVLSDAIPVTPLTEPMVFFYTDQDVGTLNDSFYWSNDGGVTARAPQAGDFLYVNPSVYGNVVVANDRISILYFSPPTNLDYMVIPKRALGTLSLTGSDIVDGSITSAKILDGSIASADIGTGAVATTNIAAGAVGSANIATGGVALTNIASAAQATLKGTGKTVTFIALAASTEGVKASNTVLADTPLPGTIQIVANGVPQNLGDGVKTTDCYFSADSGATARALTAIVAGDTLYWNGVTSGMGLLAGDIIMVRYNL